MSISLSFTVFDSNTFMKNFTNKNTFYKKLLKMNKLKKTSFFFQQQNLSKYLTRRENKFIYILKNTRGICNNYSKKIIDNMIRKCQNITNWMTKNKLQVFSFIVEEHVNLKTMKKR